MMPGDFLIGPRHYLFPEGTYIMGNKFNIGDLVKFKYNTKNRRSFVNKKCKYGIVLHYTHKKDTQYMISDKNIDFGEIYYLIYWWPHNGTLYHDEDALEIVSKMPPDIENELSGAFDI